jgi:cyclic-di-GMP phosphodiesterase TipF (flagellum assembly factor)
MTLEQAMTLEQSVNPKQKQKSENSDAPRKVVRTLEEVLRSTSVKKRPKIEVMLQPIFSLPERDVVMFEAYSRLDDKNIHERIKDFSETLAAEELRNIDIGMCEHILHIIESSNKSNSSLCLLYNVSLDVLDDSNSFGTITQKILASNIDKNNLIVEITQKDFKKLDDGLESKLRMLRENDIRLSLDNITDWSLSLERLKDIGFSFIKLRAVDFIQRAPTPEKADTLHNAFHEYGLEVICEKIESENVLSELLKRNLKFGQGYHLAPPEYIESDPYTS